ncbi:cyclic AMP-responsive element-binding protein 3-like protein 3-A [Spinachia spinachia]
MLPANVSLGDEFGLESDDLQESFGIVRHQTTSQTSTQTLTVKDLLLSSAGQTAQQIPQYSPEQLVLNEDEKKLLVKEGVNLPSKLPLSKDVCMRRSQHQAEEKDPAAGGDKQALTDLLEQLSRLQALLPNSSSKATRTGTCLLILPLSFSLLISSNLQPDPYSQPSQGEFTRTKVPSRALQLMDEVRDAAPIPLFSISRGFEALGRLKEKL